MRFRAHLLLSPYVTDTPEAEDMLSVKRGTQPECPYHMYLIKRDNMAAFRCRAPRLVD